MTTETIEILVPDSELEELVRTALGPWRRFALTRWTRSRSAAGPVAASVGLARVAQLPSLPALDPARWSRWGGCVVFVTPRTPVEALSYAARVTSAARTELQFVNSNGPSELVVEVRRIVERLYRGLESERLLHAWWSGASLHLLTSRFERAAISHRSMPELHGVRHADCRAVEVSPDGSQLWMQRAGLCFDVEELLVAARARGGVEGSAPTRGRRTSPSPGAATSARLSRIDHD